MYLLINPDGSRYWRLKYRFEGKEKVLALGVYGNDSGKVPLKLARQKRDEARKLLSDKPVCVWLCSQPAKRQGNV